MSDATRLRASLVACGVLLASSACSGGASDRPGSVVTDSAGVVIVTNEAPPAGSRLPWIVGAEPLLSIGTVAGSAEHELFEVGDALRLDDGRVLIANGGSNEVRVFDADGSFLSAWGRGGEGPGEFGQVQDLHHWPGDSIAVWDARLRRLTVFDRAGGPGRTFPLRMESGLPAGSAEIFPDGSTLASRPQGLEGVQPMTGLLPRSTEYVLLSPEAEQLANFGSYRSGSLYLRAEEMAVMTHPFQRLAFGAVWNGWALIGPSVAYELRAYRPDGSLERIVRRDHELVPVTEADLARYLESRLLEMEADRRSRMESLYEGFPLVETFPAFGALLVDAERYLWVMEYARPDDPTSVWTVFDPDGRVEGFVQLPDGFTVFEIGTDYVLGLVTDDFDIEYVRMLSLDRVTAPA